MRHTAIRLLLPSFTALSLALSAIGCSSNGETTTGAGGTGGHGPGVEATSHDAGPFTVEPGKELVMCTFVRGANEEDADVVRFETEQSAGGHHLIVYTMDHAVDLPPTLCSQGGQPSWNQLLASQIHTETVEFPEGVGFHVKAHQQYVMETHYINTSDKPISVNSTFKETYAAPGSVKQRAATYFFGTANIDIPPNGALTKTVTCTPPVPMSLHTMFGHEHRRGTGVTVDFMPGKTGPAERLYETKLWDGPPIVSFEGGHEVGTGDAVQVTCDWKNDGPTRLGYPHEMCFAIGYYWPAEAGMSCTSKGGTDECNCRYQGATDTGPGGATIAVKLTRAEKIDGVKGDPASGAPIYCSLFRAQDWDGLAPKKGATPYYFRDQVDVPLKTSSDEAKFNITDVTPGDYVLSCFMDTINGGFGVGSGDIVNSFSPKVKAVAGETRNAEATLDFAIP